GVVAGLFAAAGFAAAGFVVAGLFAVVGVVAGLFAAAGFAAAGFTVVGFVAELFAVAGFAVGFVAAGFAVLVATSSGEAPRGSSAARLGGVRRGAGDGCFAGSGGARPSTVRAPAGRPSGA